jgi:Flp pilus assembly protein TadD
MLKRYAPLVLAAVLCATGAACSKEQTSAEKQAEKVKAFRVRQKQQAFKAYSDLVEKYPDSEYAAKAKERLQQMGPVAPPAKK